MKAFLARHSISAKTFASSWLFIVGMWACSADFRGYVLSIYDALPKGVHRALGGMVIPALLFWNSRRQITASIDAPDAGRAKITAEVAPEPSVK